MKLTVLGAATLAAVSAFASSSGHPASTTARAVTARRATPHIVYTDSIGSSFLFPAVGNIQGDRGTYFKSSLVLSNYRAAPQRVAITILEQGKSNVGVAPIIRELKPYDEGGDLGLVSDDILPTLGSSAKMAAMVVQAVMPDNVTPDPNAQIDGFSRIWTPTPTTTGCPTSTGTMSQSLFAVPASGDYAIHGAEYPAFAVGLRHDEDFRTNVGIVNLSNQSRTWYVDVVGTRGEESYTLTVPAMSMQQMSLRSTSYYGTISVAFTVNVPTGQTATNDPWAAYASTVDNKSGDAWTRQASY